MSGNELVSPKESFTPDELRQMVGFVSEATGYFAGGLRAAIRFFRNFAPAHPLGSKLEEQYATGMAKMRKVFKGFEDCEEFRHMDIDASGDWGQPRRTA